MSVRSLKLAASGFALAATLSLSAVATSVPAQAADLVKLFSKASQTPNESVDHSAWDKLLKTYISDGRDGLNDVDYKAWKAGGHKALKAYIQSLEKIDVTTLTKNQQFAFWANLYNAKTIDVVLEKYPVKSIKNVSLGGSLFATFTGGPWKAKIMKVNGVKLSLDDIEHGIMRKIFKDPRVHYAVNCASVGCPNLAKDAFTGAKLNAQLDNGAAAYVNSPRGIAVKNGRVVASSIYKWFQVDFGGSEAGVLNHARKYAKPDLKAKLKGKSDIYDYEYDWSLNDKKDGAS
ncbi:MAG: DUF547 domain-containing protein [Pseudomonadota bacterium]